MALPWDHENRLTAVETDTDVTEEANRWRRELVYNGLGRLRIRKDYDWLSGWGWYPVRTTYYIYDGWLLVQERSSPTYPTATYVWGPDLSGTVGGAGGIGGLLARSTGYNRSTGTWSTHRYYHCDGMGNVMAMIDSEGNIKAAYQYDPYGRLRSWTGPEADDNPFRFSTKLWLDFGPVYYGNAGAYNMTYGLYYYGYRYYAPELQRWIGRDPVGEWDSVSLYVYVLNNPLLLVDPYGLRIRHWTDLIPDWMVSPTVVNFSAGMADYLTFNLSYGARELLGINDPVNPCSGAYKWGLRTGAIVDVGLSGASWGLRRAARAVTEAEMKALRNKARRMLAEKIEEPGKTGITKLHVHHRLPLRGHPVTARTWLEKKLGIRWHHTLFPTAGLPEWMRNARWNLKIVDPSIHIRLHQRMKSAEIIAYYGLGITNPFYNAIRIEFQSEREISW